MKKILGFLGAISLSAISLTSIVACSWTTPPIAIGNLEKIFSIMETNVLEMGSLPTLDFNPGSIAADDLASKIIEKDLSNDKIAEAIRNATDPLTSGVANYLTEQIKQQKNIIKKTADEPRYQEANLTTDLLQNMLPSYFGVVIADIKFVNDEKVQWLSEYGVDKVDFRNELEYLEIKPENNPVGSKFEINSNDEISKISVATTSQLPKLVNSETKKFNGIITTIRYLVKFNPNTKNNKEISDHAFYLDTNY